MVLHAREALFLVRPLPNSLPRTRIDTHLLDRIPEIRLRVDRYLRRDPDTACFRDQLRAWNVGDNPDARPI
mgnify:CR=1 FL=1